MGMSRRDEAILRLMLETGARAGEIAALERDDIDAAAGTAIIRRGKGGKGHIIPFGPHAALALDRYMRLRTHHRLADSPALWLGDRGKTFSYDALHKALGERANAAGVVGYHPHLMRHTAAHRSWPTKSWSGVKKSRVLMTPKLRRRSTVTGRAGRFLCRVLLGR